MTNWIKEVFKIFISIIFKVPSINDDLFDDSEEESAKEEEQVLDEPLDDIDEGMILAYENKVLLQFKDLI